MAAIIRPLHSAAAGICRRAIGSSVGLPPGPSECVRRTPYAARCPHNRLQFRASTSNNSGSGSGSSDPSSIDAGPKPKLTKLERSVCPSMGEFGRYACGDVLYHCDLTQMSSVAHITILIARRQARPCCPPRACSLNTRAS